MVSRTSQRARIPTQHPVPETFPFTALSKVSGLQPCMSIVANDFFSMAASTALEVV